MKQRTAEEHAHPHPRRLRRPSSEASEAHSALPTRARSAGSNTDRSGGDIHASDTAGVTGCTGAGGGARGVGQEGNGSGRSLQGARMERDTRQLLHPPPTRRGRVQQPARERHGRGAGRGAKRSTAHHHHRARPSSSSRSSSSLIASSPSSGQSSSDSSLSVMSCSTGGVSHEVRHASSAHRAVSGSSMGFEEDAQVVPIRSRPSAATTNTTAATTPRTMASASRHASAHGRFGSSGASRSWPRGRSDGSRDRGLSEAQRRRRRLPRARAVAVCSSSASDPRCSSRSTTVSRSDGSSASTSAREDFFSSNSTDTDTETDTDSDSDSDSHTGSSSGGSDDRSARVAAVRKRTHGAPPAPARREHLLTRLASELPYDIFLHVCEYLDDADHRTLLEVSLHTHRAITAADGTVWRRQCLSEWQYKQGFQNFVLCVRQLEQGARLDELEVIALQQRMLRVEEENLILDRSDASATCDDITIAARRQQQLDWHHQYTARSPANAHYPEKHKARGGSASQRHKDRIDTDEEGSGEDASVSGSEGWRDSSHRRRRRRKQHYRRDCWERVGSPTLTGRSSSSSSSGNHSESDGESSGNHRPRSGAGSVDGAAHAPGPTQPWDAARGDSGDAVEATASAADVAARPRRDVRRVRIAAHAELFDDGAALSESTTLSPGRSARRHSFGNGRSRSSSSSDGGGHRTRSRTTRAGTRGHHGRHSTRGERRRRSRSRSRSRGGAGGNTNRSKSKRASSRKGRGRSKKRTRAHTSRRGRGRSTAARRRHHNHNSYSSNNNNNSNPHGSPGGGGGASRRRHSSGHSATRKVSRSARRRRRHLRSRQRLLQEQQQQQHPALSLNAPLLSAWDYAEGHAVATPDTATPAAHGAGRRRVLEPTRTYEAIKGASPVLGAERLEPSHALFHGVRVPPRLGLPPTSVALLEEERDVVSSRVTLVGERAGAGQGSESTPTPAVDSRSLTPPLHPMGHAHAHAHELHARPAPPRQQRHEHQHQQQQQSGVGEARYWWQLTPEERQRELRRQAQQQQQQQQHEWHARTLDGAASLPVPGASLSRGDVHPSVGEGTEGAHGRVGGRRRGRGQAEEEQAVWAELEAADALLAAGVGGGLSRGSARAGWDDPRTGTEEPDSHSSNDRGAQVRRRGGESGRASGRSPNRDPPHPSRHRRRRRRTHRDSTSDTSATTMTTTTASSHSAHARRACRGASDSSRTSSTSVASTQPQPSSAPPSFPAETSTTTSHPNRSRSDERRRHRCRPSRPVTSYARDHDRDGHEESAREHCSTTPTSRARDVGAAVTRRGPNPYEEFEELMVITRSKSVLIHALKKSASVPPLRVARAGSVGRTALTDSAGAAGSVSGVGHTSTSDGANVLAPQLAALTAAVAVHAPRQQPPPSSDQPSSPHAPALQQQQQPQQQQQQQQPHWAAVASPSSPAVPALPTSRLSAAQAGSPTSVRASPASFSDMQALVESVEAHHSHQDSSDSGARVESANTPRSLSEPQALPGSVAVGHGNPREGTHTVGSAGDQIISSSSSSSSSSGRPPLQDTAVEVGDEPTEEVDEPHEEEDGLAPVSWKFAYYMSRREARRASVTLADLEHGSWLVCFRGTGLTHPVRFTSDQKLLVLPPLFSPAGLVEWTGAAPHAGMPPLPFHLLRGGTEMSVHNFPPLRVTRRATRAVVASSGGGVHLISLPPPSRAAAASAAPTAGATGALSSDAAFQREPQSTLRRLRDEASRLWEWRVLRRLWQTARATGVPAADVRTPAWLRETRERLRQQYTHELHTREPGAVLGEVPWPSVSDVLAHLRRRQEARARRSGGGGGREAVACPRSEESDMEEAFLALDSESSTVPTEAESPARESSMTTWAPGGAGDVMNDWGWTVSSYFVRIFSADVPSPLYVEQLRRIASAYVGGSG